MSIDILSNPIQQRVWNCDADEILLRGNRGSGKTYTLLYDYVFHWIKYKHKGKYRGLFCRQTFPQLSDAIDKARGVFKKFGGHEREGGTNWVFPDGSFFYFSHLDKASDEQGKEYDWIAVDEAGNFPTPEKPYALKSTQRNACGIPTRYFLSANAGGIGRAWIKADYIDPAPDSTIFERSVTAGDRSFVRRICSIRMLFEDNFILRAAQPDYLASVADGLSEYMYRAWVLDDWDCVPGGAFSDFWDADIHVMPRFRVPESWYIGKSFDWGSAKPYSVQWWAESDGSSFFLPDGRECPTYPGDTFLIHELYGWTGKANIGLKETTEATSEKISDVEHTLGLKCQLSVADSAIFARANGRNKSIADDYADCGILWTPCRKDRVAAAQKMRGLLIGARERDERPGLFVFDHCRNFIRTVPMLPCSPKNPDDVDTDAEDHAWDSAAYWITAEKPRIASGSVRFGY